MHDGRGALYWLPIYAHAKLSASNVFINVYKRVLLTFIWTFIASNGFYWLICEVSCIRVIRPGSMSHTLAASYLTHSGVIQFLWIATKNLTPKLMTLLTFSPYVWYRLICRGIWYAVRLLYPAMLCRWFCFSLFVIVKVKGCSLLKCESAISWSSNKNNAQCNRPTPTT